MNEWYDCYKVGNHNYQGYFKALDATLDEHGNQTGWVDYQADPEFMQAIENYKRPTSISAQRQIDLMLVSLQKARDRFKKLRLLFSGGTDSWTILKICMENKIYIDEVLCHLHSFEESPENMQNRTNIEFIPGLRYAKKYEGSLIGKIITPRHSIDTLKQFVDDEDIHKHAPGPFLPLRSAMYYRYLQQLDTTDTGTITGLEKPEFIVENDKLFWVLMDSPTGEWMGIKNHIPLYLDKHNPELAVHMAYTMLDILPVQHLKGEYRHINWVKCDVDSQASLIDAWGIKTPYNWLNMHTMKSKTHAMAPKTAYFLKEAKVLGVMDLIDEYMLQMKKIHEKYGHLPHSVTLDNKWTSSVGRFSQRIQIHQDRFGKIQAK